MRAARETAKLSSSIRKRVDLAAGDGEHEDAQAGKEFSRNAVGFFKTLDRLQWLKCLPECARKACRDEIFPKESRA
jgi:hypothetical protein